MTQYEERTINLTPSWEVAMKIYMNLLQRPYEHEIQEKIQMLYRDYGEVIETEYDGDLEGNDVINAYNQSINDISKVIREAYKIDKSSAEEELQRIAKVLDKMNEKDEET